MNQEMREKFALAEQIGANFVITAKDMVQSLRDPTVYRMKGYVSCQRNLAGKDSHPRFYPTSDACQF